MLPDELGRAEWITHWQEKNEKMPKRVLLQVQKELGLIAKEDKLGESTLVIQHNGKNNELVNTTWEVGLAIVGAQGYVQKVSDDQLVEIRKKREELRSRKEDEKKREEDRRKKVEAAER